MFIAGLRLDPNMRVSQIAVPMMLAAMVVRFVRPDRAERPR